MTHSVHDVTTSGRPEDYPSRQWRPERTLWTRDTLGLVVPITTGVTIDVHGAIVPAVGIGLESTAVLSPSLRDRVVENMRLVINVAVNVRRGQM
jgi:hypothetical protein